MRRKYQIVCALLLWSAAAVTWAQSYGTVRGRVLDPSGRVVPGAEILLQNLDTRAARRTGANSDGIYEIPALPAGTYRIQVRAAGFRPCTVESIAIDVARTVVQDVALEIGDFTQEVTVTSQAGLVDRATISVGHVLRPGTVQELPLNGQHFLDLAVLAPGSVTAPQSAFSAAPTRGLGAQAMNTAGNREETVNYVVNGITLNDLVYSSLLFQPSTSVLQEFKVDNSTVSAQYGQSSGAVVHLGTRSGTDQFHVEAFEYFRNNVLDARNFFTLTSSEPPPFKRNQFGGTAGGPIAKGRTFFFVYYEGFRQSQAVDLNSLVLSDAERASSTSPAINKLIALLPRPNFFDSGTTPRFIGSAPAPVSNDQEGVDISHTLSKAGRLHAFYSNNHNAAVEPSFFGTTLPGFGHSYRVLRQFFSVGETQTIGQNWISEFRLGLNRLSASSRPMAELNPADFGIRDGITQPIGIPQINVAGGALNFGGPSPFPSGRADLTLVAGETVSWLRGRHSLKFGGEFRQFLNNNFRVGTGSLSFPSVTAFLADIANSFSITLGSQTSSVAEGALGSFVQDNYNARPNLVIELGIRYDWNMTPTERYGRFVVFNPQTGSIERLGRDRDVYRQNNKNVQPRVGFAWDPFRDGKTAVRAAYAILTDQPMTSVVTGTAANPPLATPLTVTGAIPLETAIDLARAGGLNPTTVDANFQNAYLQSWNLNLQRELTPGVVVTTGYFGSKGTHLILRRNINQPVVGARPYPAVSASSSILAGAPLGNITQAESTGNSTYNALWVSASKALAPRLHLHVSYNWSKSLDYNSLSSQGVVVQDSYNLRNSRGLSDFDARHRVVVQAVYDLPIGRRGGESGWQAAVIVQAQSGNPINIVTTSSANGTVGTLRPNVSGSVRTAGQVDNWFDTSVFSSALGFGNLGRNAIIGPGFSNTDFSIAKSLRLGERLRIKIRAEAFDVLNHANFGQPGNVVGSPSFGHVTNTRFPTGESGSSRQLQIGMKLIL